MSQAHAVDGGTLILDTASGPHKFTVELATTDAERALGLMYRPMLDADHGMLFLYDAPRPISMWMKNTRIPLDMVFIDIDATVHRVQKEAEPFSLTPISSEGDVLGVLELNGGTADAIGLKVGDKVEYPGIGTNPKLPPADSPAGEPPAASPPQQ